MSVTTKAAPPPLRRPAPKVASPHRGGLLRSAGRALPLTPAVVLLLLFLAGPIVYCAYIAFTDLQLTGQAHSSFVGFDNFRRRSATTRSSTPYG